MKTLKLTLAASAVALLALVAYAPVQTSVPLRQNFATTNDAVTLTNIIQSLGGGSGFPLTNDANLAGYSLTNGNTISATNINAQSLKVGDLTVTNASITTLSPTSNQTNYTVTLSSLPNVAVIHLANTNAFLTFANTNQIGYQCTVALRAITNSITVTWSVNLPGMATNLNTIYYVTNGTVRFVNFYNLDTTGTNVVVSDAGTANHT